MAAWMLQEASHGTNGRLDNGDFDALSAFTALGFSTANRTQQIERFTTWSQVWNIADDHPACRAKGWNGARPSDLRSTFRDEVGISIDQWLAGSFMTLLPRWVDADTDKSVQFTDAVFSDFFGSDRKASEALRELMLGELSTTFEELGDEILRRTAAYTGLGSTSQTESSPLHERPLIRFSDGTMTIASAEAFASRSVALPRTIIERSQRLGGRRDVGGAIGKLFEANGWDVVQRLRGTHAVVTSNAIDDNVVKGTRADALVANADAAVVLEFTLLPTDPRATTGDRQSIREALDRYVRKVRQATGTPVHALSGLFAKIGHLEIGHFVVVDEPISFSAAHSASIQGTDPDLPPLFVISIDELESLIDLADGAVSAPHALIAWQRGEQRVPFTQHIAQLHRLVPPNRSRLTGTMERLYRVALPDAPPVAA